jgi:hypothetical protein
MRWKVLTVLFGSLWLITLAVFAYSLIDQGVSYTYLKQSYSDLKSSNEFLGKTIVESAKDYSQADILHLLRQSNRDSFIVEEEGKIILENTTFYFENGELTRVKYQHDL